MTIGIAALCTRQEGDKDYGVIIGAADRLITIGQGEITYEPSQRKIHMLTPLIVAIPGGNVNINAEVVKKTKETLHNRTGVTNHLVDDVADLYGQQYIDYVSRSIERTVLSQRHLNWDSYNNRNYIKDPDWFTEGKIKVFGVEDPISETIIAGVDEDGPQIFVVCNGWARREDWAGFTTVGIGSEHADLEFMIAKHTSAKSYSDTLLLTYIAKQRANMAAQVGDETDLFSISLKDGYIDLSKELELLAKTYNDFSLRHEKDKHELYNKVRGIMQARPQQTADK